MCGCLVYFDTEHIAEAAAHLDLVLKGQRLHLSSSSARDAKATLFVGNVPYDAEEADLHEVLGVAGPLAEVRLMRKGMAFVDFVNPEDATKAVTELQGCACLGAPLRLESESHDNRQGPLFRAPRREPHSARAQQPGSGRPKGARRHGPDPRKLFLGNVAADTTEENLREVFNDHNVTEVSLHRKPGTERISYAFECGSAPPKRRSRRSS
ncbi:unnamed protein product [Effrenium voratum]|nr:unnamed protein product [Effrenium voratum]